MKIPEQDEKFNNFDRFQQFYRRIDSDLNLFETNVGQVFTFLSRPDPDYRRIYRGFETLITATADNNNIKWTSKNTGEAIPKAWLCREGIEYFWLDLSKQLAVPIKQIALSPHKQYVPDNIPKYTSIYWASISATPIAAPCVYHPPITYTEDEKVFVKELVKIAKVIVKLAPPTSGIDKNTIAEVRTVLKDGMSPEQYAANLSYRAIRELSDRGAAALGYDKVVERFITWK